MTQRHAANCVAAKARLRIARAETAVALDRPSRLKVRRGRAKWRIQIRDLEYNDSLTLTLHRLPWPARYCDDHHREWSARQIANAVKVLLTSAP